MDIIFVMRKGAKVENKPMTSFVLLIIILVTYMVYAVNITAKNLAIGTIVNTTTTTPTNSDQPTGNITNTKYLEVTNQSFSEDLLFTVVNGTVINNSNNTINSVEINVQFYDDNGELITSKSGKARSVILGPGENSSFNVRSDLSDEMVHSYNVMPGGDIGEG
jgi:hypothetical protein